MQKFTATISLLLATLLAAYGTRAVDEQRVDADIEADRAELNRLADESIAELRRDGDDDAARRLETAYGYAVFSAAKAGAIVTGAAGPGVAIARPTDETVYMQMGGAGAGLGAGLQSYRLVLLFEHAEAFDRFVDGGWTASGSAQAMARALGGTAGRSFVDGVAVYQLGDSGVIPQLDIVSARFWRQDDLNEPH